MPTLSSVKNLNGGKSAYVYDLSSDDITSLVTQLSASADAPIAFFGRMNGITEQIDELMYVETLLDEGGQVAANAQAGGMPVNIQFSGRQMVVIPGDGQQSTADMFVGAGDFAYTDDDDFDPFASASNEFPVPDPRGRSQQLANRYGDDEDEYEDMETSGGYGNNTAYAPAPTGDIVKVSDWLLTYILLMIPVVNIIMLILWLVSKKTNPSKKNFLKVQIIFMVVGILLSAFTVVAAMQMGVVGALVGGQDQTAQIENMEDSADRRVDDTDNMVSWNENEEQNVNETGNANEEENGNTGAPDVNENAGVSDTVPEPADPTQLGELSQESSGILAVDTISRALTPDNRPVAIVTLTMNNTGDTDASAASLIDITGYQGQNALSPCFDPIDGFSPDTFNMHIRPHESGTFQICYYLVDDQDLKIHASMKQTHEVILDATQMLH